MNTSSQEFWDDKLTTFYKNSSFAKEHNQFAEEAEVYFPRSAKILELGAGRGQDSFFFVKKGHTVVATDFAEKSLALLQESIETHGSTNISATVLDLTSSFPFESGRFDVVYAHLSLHYFSRSITEQIFKEIQRVLRHNGILALLVNSLSDAEYRKGVQVEEDYFHFGEGNVKRFFTPDSLRSYIGSHFSELLCDDFGTTKKDGALGNNRLVRYIGEVL